MSLCCSKIPFRKRSTYTTGSEVVQLGGYHASLANNCNIDLVVLLFLAFLNVASWESFSRATVTAMQHIAKWWYNILFRFITVVIRTVVNRFLPSFFF